MTTLLEKALHEVESLASDEQDAIAAQILDSLADETAWKIRFAASTLKLRQLEREALDEDERGETLPLNDLL